MVTTSWTELAGQGEIKAAIAAFVKSKEGVSFVELERNFEKYCKTQGEIALTMPRYENLILWVGLSEGFANDLQAAISEKLIFPHATHPILYLIDGRVPTFPVAKRIPKKGYQAPHWLPIVFNSTPPRAKRGRATAS